MTMTILIKMTISDECLGEILRKLSEYGNPSVSLIPNIQQITVVPNNIVDATENGTKVSLISKFTTYLQEKQIKELDIDDIKRFLKSHGYSPMSHTYTINEAIRNKIIDRGPVKGKFIVRS